MTPNYLHPLTLDLNVSNMVIDIQIIQLILIVLIIGSLGLLLGRIIEERNSKSKIAAIESELHKAREEAKKGIAEKNQFLSNMSHEIRTPLNGVVGLIDQLLNSDLNENQHKYASAINFSANTLISLVNQILDLSKINSKKLVLEQVDFDLKETIDSITGTFMSNTKDKGIGLRAIVHQNVPRYVCGDQVRFTQILMNLVGNAVKFTNRGGVDIVIESQKNDDGIRLLIEVNDTGAGIPAEQLESIFDAYNQATSETSRLYGGTGLGLSIARELIELYGGQIKVTSKLGKGSTFSYELQLKEAKKTPLSISRTLAQTHHKPETTRVLLAEDNVVNQMVVKSILEPKGYQLTIVNNGQEVIEEIYKGTYDVILMDVQMPIMGGLDATRFIRNATEAPLSEIKIIALTASVLKEDIKACYNVGVNDFLSKPFKTNELLEKIDQNIQAIAS
ncbi:MAG: ATP-binding protein [Cyclobacteriaceae bacterium]